MAADKGWRGSERRKGGIHGADNKRVLVRQAVAAKAWFAEHPQESGEDKSTDFALTAAMRMAELNPDFKTMMARTDDSTAAFAAMFDLFSKLASPKNISTLARARAAKSPKEVADMDTDEKSLPEEIWLKWYRYSKRHGYGYLRDASDVDKLFLPGNLLADYTKEVEKRAEQLKASDGK